MKPNATEAALLDLWRCINVPEIHHLQPETIQLAKELHQRYEHGDDDGTNP